jgi:hypothetical protein
LNDPAAVQRVRTCTWFERLCPLTLSTTCIQDRDLAALLSSIPEELPVPPRPPAIELDAAIRYHQLDLNFATGPSGVSRRATLASLRRRFSQDGSELYQATRAVSIVHLGQGDALVENADTLPPGLVVLRVERSQGQAIPLSPTQEPLAVLVHGALFAIYAALLPSLAPPPRARNQADNEGTRRPSPRAVGLVPVIPIALPSPETFIALTDWLYLRRTTRLERFIMPPDGADLGQIMEHVSRCTGIWSNAAVLGILHEDEELAACLRSLWMVLRTRSIELVVEEEQEARGRGARNIQ